MGPKNRNTVKCNLPVEEVAALKELIKLQRERVINKSCDKGAGIMILDFKTYMQACYEHLLEKQTNTQGEKNNYYMMVEDYEIDKSKVISKNILNEALESEIITKEEFTALVPSNKNLAKFYMNFNCINLINQ